MFGRKKVVRITEVRDHDLEQAITNLASPHRERALKDLHVVSAALLTDRVILSCDDHARAAFAALQAPPSLNDLLWANPHGDAAAILDWLGRGAPDEADYRLIPPQP